MHICHDSIERKSEKPHVQAAAAAVVWWGAQAYLTKSSISPVVVCFIIRYCKQHFFKAKSHHQITCGATTNCVDVWRLGLFSLCLSPLDGESLLQEKRKRGGFLASFDQRGFMRRKEEAYRERSSEHKNLQRTKYNQPTKTIETIHFYKDSSIHHARSGSHYIFFQ